MATTAQRQALAAAHSKSARRKAAATMVRQAAARNKLATRFGEGPRAFTTSNLISTIRRHEIPLTDIPDILINPLPPKVRARLLAKRTNGVEHARGVGIPLDAIPPRPAKDAAKVKGAATKLTMKQRHLELVEKVVDALARPETNEKVADRLLKVLDRFLN